MKPKQNLQQAVSTIPQKKPFSIAIQSEGYKNLINNTLGDPKRAGRFVTAITSAVSTNPALQECDAGTILSSALIGESLGLSPSPQLGQYYLVPYNDTKNNRKVAQIQIGYKAYVQLAIRTGQYKKLNVLPIKYGELIRFDPLNEEIEVNLIDDDEEREKAPTIGYYAMFELVNGFRKAMYWSKEKMLAHADKYSNAFSKENYQLYVSGNVPKSELWKYSSFWYKDFDGMAMKTMLRQLLSKYGVMSIEMQTAYANDQGVPVVQNNEFVGVDYVDNRPKSEYKEPTEPVVVEGVPAEDVLVDEETGEILDDDDPLA